MEKATHSRIDSISVLSYTLNTPLMSTAISLWSISTNSFHCPYEMMSPNLLDLATLLGVRPDRESINALFSEQDFSIPPASSGFEKNLSY